MAEAFLKVDGVAMPCPSSFTWGLQDISASESGRTDDTTMHKNRVGQKRKLSVGWNGPDWDTACKIIQVNQKGIGEIEGTKFKDSPRMLKFQTE